ncbi:hypothetical protein JCM33374_g2692 [Metschnikowia sp. JCM 33374]|nr:hypothetical protein JCM33374_g2692 [Metschnikowia sp. JCM 33374]
MTKSSRVLKLHKLNILKKSPGPRTEASPTGLIAAEATTPTEPSLVNTESKLYKMTKRLSSKKHKASKSSSTELTSSQSPSGDLDLATETATKTTTTTTNGAGSKTPTISTFTRFSGLLTWTIGPKRQSKFRRRFMFPADVHKKMEAHSAQNLPTFTVDQSVDTEKVGTMNNGSATHEAQAMGSCFQGEFSLSDFPPVTQTQELKAGAPEGRQFQERDASHDSSLKCSTSNDATTCRSETKSGRKRTRHLKKSRNTKRSIQKVCRIFSHREDSCSKDGLYGQTEVEGHKDKHSWWKRSKVSHTLSLEPTSDSVRTKKEVSKYGFCRVLFRKLHVESVTRKVGGWSRKVRMAAKSSSSGEDFWPVHEAVFEFEGENGFRPEFLDVCGCHSDLGGETESMLELVVPCGEQIVEPVLFEDDEEVEITQELETTEELDNDTDDTDDTDDTESIDTFTYVCETQVIQVSGGEEDGLQEIDESPSGWEVTGLSPQTILKSFSSAELPISQILNLSSRREDSVQLENQKSSETRRIRQDFEAITDPPRTIAGSSMENTQISQTSQIYPQGRLENESVTSPYALQELINTVTERFGKSCNDSLTLTESAFLNERGLLRSLSDTEGQERISQPISNSRHLNAIQGMDIEGDSSPIEGPQITKEEHSWTRKFSLTPSYLGRGFMKELHLVGRLPGHVDAERSEVVPKTTEGVHAEADDVEGSIVQSHEGIREYGSLTRRLHGFTLDVIERNTETGNETTIDMERSCLDSKDGEELEDIEYYRLALGLGSSPIEQKDTLWYFLDLSGRDDWQRIRDDFLQGEDLHITCEAKKRLSSLPKMRSTSIEKANLGGDNYCRDNFARKNKVAFSQQLVVFSTQKAPYKCILKNSTGANTNDVGVLKLLEPTWTVEDRQALEQEMLQRFIDCRETMCKFSGKHGLAGLKEPLDTFTSCFSFTLNNYVRIAKKQFLDYNHYVSEIRNSLATALGVLEGAGEHFCILIDYISITPKSPQSLLEVQQQAGVLKSSISSSDLYLQKAQNSLTQVTLKDLVYASTMVDIFHKGMLSQTHICDTYKMFRSFFLQDLSEKEEADAVTGFGVFEEEMEALHNPVSYSGMTKLGNILGSLQKSCDVINNARKDIETRATQIIERAEKLGTDESTRT